MTEEVIKEVVITSTPHKSDNQDQLMDSPDTGTDGNCLPPDLVKRKEKPVPHYLRASTRSCHDNCKFGTHHSPEPKKPWHVVRRPPQLRRASTGSQGINKVEIMLPKSTRPRKDQKLKITHVKDCTAPAPTPVKPEHIGSKGPQEPAPDHSESIRCVEGDLPPEDASVPGNLPTDAECFVVSHVDEASDGAESIELEMPLAIQDSDASDENVEDGGLLASDNACKDRRAKSLADPVSDRSSNSSESASSDVRRNALTVMKNERPGPGTESKGSTDDPVKLKEKAVLGVNGNTVSVQKSGRTSLPRAATVANSETATEPKPARARANASVATSTATKLISRQRKPSHSVTSALPKVKEIKAPSSPTNATGSSAKPARLTKSKASTVKNASSSSLSSEKQVDRKMAAKNVTRNAQAVQKQREEKVKPRVLKLSCSMNLSAKSISSVKVRVIKKEKIDPPITNSKKVSGTDGSAADAKDGKERSLKPASLKMRKADSVKGKETHKEKTETPAPRKRTLTRTSKPTPVPSSTATPPPRKLTFRRGKVLNPDENGGSSSTPARRLRFRPAAVAAADTSVSRSRVFSRVSSGKQGTGRSSAARAGTSRAEVVVLRRRQGGVSVDEKKKKQAVLLNNVIEETASRLVSEARKSKVKALVGAFETVISLQEGGKAGPATTTAVAQ